MIYIAQIKERRKGGNHVDTRTASGVEGNMAKPSDRLVRSVHLMVRHQVLDLVIRVRFSYRLQYNFIRGYNGIDSVNEDT